MEMIWLILAFACVGLMIGVARELYDIVQEWRKQDDIR